MSRYKWHPCRSLPGTGASGCARDPEERLPGNHRYVLRERCAKRREM